MLCFRRLALVAVLSLHVTGATLVIRHVRALRGGRPVQVDHSREVEDDADIPQDATRTSEPPRPRNSVMQSSSQALSTGRDGRLQETAASVVTQVDSREREHIVEANVREDTMATADLPRAKETPCSADVADTLQETFGESESSLVPSDTKEALGEREDVVQSREVSSDISAPESADENVPEDGTATLEPSRTKQIAKSMEAEEERVQDYPSTDASELKPKCAHMPLEVPSPLPDELPDSNMQAPSRRSDSDGNEMDASVDDEEAGPTSATFLRAGERLGEQYLRLGNMSSDLLAIGVGVDRAEQELLGHVLDASEARRLLDRHEELENANRMSKEHLNKLRDEIEKLYVRVSDADRAFDAAEEMRQSELVTLASQIDAEDVAMQHLKLQRDVSLIPVETEKHDRLVQEHAKLLEHRVQLAQLERELEEQRKAEEELESTLLEDHNRALVCHDEAERLQHEVRTLRNTAPRHTAATLAASKQAESLEKAHSQRLVSEAALLVAEIRRREAMSGKAMEHLHASKREFRQLEVQVVQEVQSIQSKMDEAKNHTAFIQMQLRENVEQSEVDVGKHSTLQEQLRKLHEQLSPVIFTALEAENEALQRELYQALDYLRESKGAEARAYASASHADVEVESQNRTNVMLAAQAEAAEEEGIRRLKEAMNLSAAAKEKARSVEQKAISVISAHCTPKWDQRSQTMDGRMEECKALKESIAVAKAERDMLKETLKARETASAVSSGPVERESEAFTDGSTMAPAA